MPSNWPIELVKITMVKTVISRTFDIKTCKTCNHTFKAIPKEHFKTLECFIKHGMPQATIGATKLDCTITKTKNDPAKEC